MQHLIGVIDSMFLGRIGKVELGAAGLGGIYYLSFFMLGFGFSIGAQIIIARRNGEGNYRAVGPVFMQSLFFLIVLAVICVFSVRHSAPLLLAGMIESENVYASTLEYVGWRSYGYVFSFVMLVFRAFFVGTTQTKVLTMNAAVLLVVNTVLDYLLIFGEYGFPAWGIAGAAVASVLAELCALAFLVFYTFIYSSWREYGLFRFYGMKLRLFADVLKTSIWTMLQSFAAMGVWFIFFIAVENLGEEQLAVSNAVRNVSAMLFMFVSAFSTTANSLISNIIGSGGQRHVMPLTKRLVKMCFFIQLPFWLVITLFPSSVLSCFTNDPVLVSAATASLLVMSTSYLLHVPAFIYLAAVTGTGNTRVAMEIEFVALAIYLVSVVFIAVQLRADVAVCWFTEHVYALVLFMLCWHYMKSGKWKNRNV